MYVIVFNNNNINYPIIFKKIILFSKKKYVFYIYNTIIFKKIINFSEKVCFIFIINYIPKKEYLFY
jgi:hypothetical protein